METKDFKPQQRVIYIPPHARQFPNGPTRCPAGTVSSVNDNFVFVKFDEQVSKLGWEGTTSQGCYPGDLEHE